MAKSFCHVHGIDEDWDDDCYRACLECGHVYRSASELRQAYRAWHWPNDRTAQGTHRMQPWIWSNEYTWSKLRDLWTCITLRVKDIYGCQHCAHDW